MNELKSVFLDTSFFIRFFKPDDPHHAHAQAYFRRFRKDGVKIFFSTIGVAEYGVAGNLDHLPYPFLTLLPFNIDDARLSTTMARKAFAAKRKGTLAAEQSITIPSDVKLLAQAEVCKSDLFIALDEGCQQVFDCLKTEGLVSFKYLDLRTPPNQFFGELFEED